MTVLGQQKNGHVIELGLALSLLIVSISLAPFLASNRGHRCTLASVLHTHTHTHAHILNPVYINHLSKRARNLVVLTITAATRTRKSNPALGNWNGTIFHLDTNISNDCQNDWYCKKKNDIRSLFSYLNYHDMSFVASKKKKIDQISELDSRNGLRICKAHDESRDIFSTVQCRFERKWNQLLKVSFFF